MRSIKLRSRCFTSKIIPTKRSPKSSTSRWAPSSPGSPVALPNSKNSSPTPLRWTGPRKDPMTNQQAKEILMLFRPGTDDPADPDFARALALAKGDPELASWFDEHCQAREAIRVRFKAIAVPEGLKEQILAER